MMLPVLLLFFFVHQQFSINFLLDKTFDYDKPTLLMETSAKVEFKQNSLMAGADDYFDDMAKTLNYWDFTSAQIDDKQNIIAKFLSEFKLITKRIKTQNAVYNKILGKATAAPTMDTDKNVTITIDEEFLTALFADMDTIANNTYHICKVAGTLDTLLADNVNLPKYGSQVASLINLLKDYVSALRTYVLAAKRTLDNDIPEIIKADLLLDGNRLIDFDNIEVLTYGKTNNDLVFYLEIKIYTTGSKVREQIPVAYFSYSLDDSYVYDTKQRKITKILTDSESSSTKKYRIDSCLEQLNFNNNNTKIIDQCDFVFNPLEYVLTPKGILFQSADLALLNTINTFFSQKLTLEDFPIYITYNDSFTFTTKSLQSVTINRTAPLSLHYSTLSKDDRDYLNQKLFNHSSPGIFEEKLKFIEYILEDYHEILINVVILIIVIIIFFALKFVYNKLTDSQRHVTRRVTDLLLNRYRRTQQ